MLRQHIRGQRQTQRDGQCHRAGSERAGASQAAPRAVTAAEFEADVAEAPRCGPGPQRRCLRVCKCRIGLTRRQKKVLHETPRRFDVGAANFRLWRTLQQPHQREKHGSLAVSVVGVATDGFTYGCVQCVVDRLRG
jgi:hypothetical protein